LNSHFEATPVGFIKPYRRRNEQARI